MLGQGWRDLWTALFVILIFIGVSAGHGLVIGFGVMGLLVEGVSWVWNKVSLEKLSYERRVSQNRAFIGEEVSMTVTLTNGKPVPLAMVKLVDDVPDGIHVDSHDIATGSNARKLSRSTSISQYERIRWEYRIKASQRGLYRIGPARIESGDPFGLFSSERSDPDQELLLVYPKVVPLPELGLPASRPLGESLGGIRLFQDQSRPAGIRDYQNGDPLNTVDWKATARAQRLQVRTFDSSSSITVLLCVALETVAHVWQGYSPTRLERVVTTAASVASYATERQYSLGLFSNGTLMSTGTAMNIAPSRSPGQLTNVLETLATIRALALGPMAVQLAEHSRRFPLGATVVLVAAFVSPELVEVLGDLRDRGHRVFALYLGDEPCPEMPHGVILHELSDHIDLMEQSRVFGSR